MIGELSIAEDLKRSVSGLSGLLFIPEFVCD
jgi:hypothetical protein